VEQDFEIDKATPGERTYCRQGREREEERKREGDREEGRERQGAERERERVCECKRDFSTLQGK